MTKDDLFPLFIVLLVFSAIAFGIYCVAYTNSEISQERYEELLAVARKETSIESKMDYALRDDGVITNFEYNDIKKECNYLENLAKLKQDIHVKAEAN
jgi:hypothetical protein